MKNILNQLIQLQELDFALAEEKASTSKMPLEQLEGSVAKIMKMLPEDIAVRYERLHKRFPPAVVPIKPINALSTSLMPSGYGSPCERKIRKSCQAFVFRRGARLRFFASLGMTD